MKNHRSNSKTSGHRKLTLYKPRNLGIAIGFVVVFAAAGLVIRTTSHAAPIVTPARAFTGLCDNSGNSNNECLDLVDDTTIVNTPIVIHSPLQVGDDAYGWFPDVRNGICNNGKVDANTSCPFTAGSGLNSRYNNDKIVEIRNWADPDFCVGSKSNQTVLKDCPSRSGDIYGATFVEQGTYLISVASSDAELCADPQFHDPCYLEAFIGGNPVSTVGETTATNPTAKGFKWGFPTH